MTNSHEPIRALGCLCCAMAATLGFQTTRLSPDQYVDALRRASGQDERVLALFRLSPEPMTPSAVHAQLGASGYECPITSIRRSMSTLTRDGYLVKLWDASPGPWGMPEHKWRLRGAA